MEEAVVEEREAHAAHTAPQMRACTGRTAAGTAGSAPQLATQRNPPPCAGCTCRCAPAAPCWPGGPACRCARPPAAASAPPCPAAEAAAWPAGVRERQPKPQGTASTHAPPSDATASSSSARTHPGHHATEHLDGRAGRPHQPALHLLNPQAVVPPAARGGGQRGRKHERRQSSQAARHAARQPGSGATAAAGASSTRQQAAHRWEKRSTASSMISTV